jgi:hypothetical protein
MQKTPRQGHGALSKSGSLASNTGHENSPNAQKIQLPRFIVVDPSGLVLAVDASLDAAHRALIGGGP